MVTGIASTCEQTVKLAANQQPDIILMDIILEGDKDGIDAAETIYANDGIQVIFMSGHADESIVAKAKRARPLAFLVKPVTDEQLLVQLEVSFHQIAQEKKNQSSAVQAFPNGLQSWHADLPAALTPAEVRIAALVRKGMSSKEIADFLNTSDQTVMWHRKNIRKKLHLSNKKVNLTMHLLQ